MIPCSKRLQKIIDCIDGNVLADIGCDHGYVAVNAVLDYRVKKAYACDIAPQPLERAKNTIRQAHVEEQVTCLLMNGMEDLPEDVDHVVVAGMGAHTLMSILDQANRKEEIKFIFSPHNDAPSFREYLRDHHFQIIREQIVYDANHYYPIMECIYEKNVTMQFTDWEIQFGKNVVENIEYHEYIQHLTYKYEKLLKQIPEDKQTKIQTQYDLLRKKDTL